MPLSGPLTRLTSWLPARRLAKQYARGIDALITDLGDRDPRTRERAANTLFRLAEQLTPQERRAAEAALAVAARKDDTGLVRSYATAALLALGCDDAVPIALAALGDRDWDVRTFVAFELGRVHDPRIVDALIPLLQDPEGWVREAAAYSLGKLKDPRALPPLRELAKRERKDVHVKKAAKGAVKALEKTERAD